MDSEQNQKTSRIESLSQEEFEKLKENVLYKDWLSEEDLDRIGKLSDFTDDGNPMARLSCDELHGHSYRCLTYQNRNSAVISRLISEVRTYQEKLKKIKSYAEE